MILDAVVVASAAAGAAALVESFLLLFDAVVVSWLQQSHADGANAVWAEGPADVRCAPRHHAFAGERMDP